MKIVILMEYGNYVFDQLIDFFLLLALGGFECLLHALLRLPFDINSLSLDLIDDLWILNKRIKLWHDLTQQLFSLNWLPRLIDLLFTLQFLMQIDLLYVILQKDDLYLLLLNIFESTEYFKA